MSSQVVWQGSTKCDFCKRDVTKVGPEFFDAKTLNGQWALMCVECFLKHTGGTLGTGNGQKYDSVSRIKVGG